jgi:amino acid transporter
VSLGSDTSARRRPIALGLLAGFLVPTAYAVGAIRAIAYMIDFRDAASQELGIDLGSAHDVPPLLLAGDRLFQRTVVLVVLFGLALLVVSAVVGLRGLADTEQRSSLPGATLVLLGLALIVAGAMASRVTVLRMDRLIEAVGLTPELAASQHAVAVTESLSTVIFGLFGAVVPTFVGFALIGVAASRRS